MVAAAASSPLFRRSDTSHLQAVGGFHTSQHCMAEKWFSEPTEFLKYNDIVYPPQKEGELPRPAVSYAIKALGVVNSVLPNIQWTVLYKHNYAYHKSFRRLDLTTYLVLFIPYTLTYVVVFCTIFFCYKCFIKLYTFADNSIFIEVNLQCRL